MGTEGLVCIVVHFTWLHAITSIEFYSFVAFICFSLCFKFWEFVIVYHYTGRDWKTLARNKCWFGASYTNGNFLCLMNMMAILPTWSCQFHKAYALCISGGYLSPLLWRIPHSHGRICSWKCSKCGAICSICRWSYGTLISLQHLLSYWTCSNSNAGAFFSKSCYIRVSKLLSFTLST